MQTSYGTPTRTSARLVEQVMKHKARCCFLLKVRQSSRQDDVSADGRESKPRDGKPSKVDDESKE